MISERRLARGFTSFWKTTLPLSEAFVRRVNATSRRYLPEYQSSLSAERSALVSELGFRLAAIVRSGSIGRPSEEAWARTPLNETVTEALEYLSRLPGVVTPIQPPTQEERTQACGIGDRILQFIRSTGPVSEPEFHPRFPGCGFVDECSGDLLIGDTLYEVKSVERGFQSADLRQLLIYAALDSVRPHPRIAQVGLLNPRLGTAIEMSLSELSLGMAGTLATDLLARIVHFISAEQLSR